MEKLVERFDDKGNLCEAISACKKHCLNGGISSCRCDPVIKVRRKLFAYESTGLEPDEIPHWIPVSERLPELDELVLLFLDDSKEQKITTGKRYAVDGIITDDGRYNGKWCVGFDRLDPDFLVEKYVTHWAELPAAPKEET